MAKLTPLEDRRRHIMREAAKRWADRPRGQKVRDQLAALGGDPAGLDTPLREKQFAERTAVLQQAAELRAAGQLPIGLERKIGATLDFVENAPSEAARKAGRPVVRIVTSCDPKVVAVGFATGFVVSPRLILTNWHVFPDLAQARGNGVNFFYERDERGVGLGETFEIDPDYFFLSNERLDFALVGFSTTAVSGATLADVNPVAMTSSPAKILVGQPVNIVQHPDGGPKTWVTMNDNRLIDLSDDGFLQYTADTLQGSSGSPVFSTSWELVGLHHSGVPEMHDGKIVSIEGTEWNEDMGDEKIHWIANEGARTSAIVRALAETRLDDPRQQGVLNNFLAGTADPIEQVKQLLGGTAAESTGAQISVATTAPAINAGDRQMVFTGPVTIIVGGAQRADAAAPLGPAFERTIQFDPNYDDRKGYQADFLGSGLLVPAPTVAKTRNAEILMKDGAPHVLDYHHYSLVLSSSRRLPMWTAANVDYSPDRRKIGGRAGFGTDKWVFDPRIPKEVQLGDQFYEPAHQSDRGHVVRRQDSAWGDTDQEVEFANSDTFHWTNCTPQHAAFNRAVAPSKYQLKEGLWGGFEMYTQSQLQHGDTRACILAGPVLAEDDPVVDLGKGPVKVPRRFWKVVVVAAADAKKPALQAYGFLLSQDDLLEKFGIEFAPGRFAKYAASLESITEASGVQFDKALLAAEVPVQG
jgi:endonuclease G